MEEMEVQSMTANSNATSYIEFTNPQNYFEGANHYQPEGQWVLPSVVLDVYDNGVGNTMDRVQFKMPKDMIPEVFECYDLWLAAIPEGSEYDLIRANMEKIIDDMTRTWEAFADTTVPTLPPPPPPSDA